MVSVSDALIFCYLADNLNASLPPPAGWSYAAPLVFDNQLYGLHGLSFVVYINHFDA